jgi:SPP1 family predicted phage head-tail adaptor
MPRQVTPQTMRTQIEIQVATKTTNARGELLASSWANLVTVYAEATQVRARDFFGGGKEQLPVDVIFRLRWRDGITAAHRVMWRGEPYEITGEPVDIDGRRITLELNCIKGVRDGR